MRIRLDDLSMLGFGIELPSREDSSQFVQVESASHVRGELTQGPDRVEVPDASAEEVTLREGRLCFGAVVLRAAASLVLQRVELSFSAVAGAIQLNLRSEQARCMSFVLEVGAIAIAAEVRMDGLKLSQSGDQGQLEAASVELGNLSLRHGALTVRAPSVKAHDLRVAWSGHDGFAMAVSSMQVADVALAKDFAAVRIAGLACEGLVVRDGAFEVAALTAERVDVEAHSPASEDAPQELDTPRPVAPETPRREVADWSLLDAISGRVQAELGVHASFAIMQRHAVHKLGLDVEQGEVNYSELEHGLSLLEDSLLDFSLREQELVLELGVPLLPTRGHGKRLLSWFLSPQDAELAERGRVRLNVLMHPTPPPAAEPTQEPSASESKFKLHTVDAATIDVVLSLAPARSFASVMLRELGFERLAVQGALQYHHENADKAGHLALSADGIRLALSDVPVGTNTLDLAGMRIGSISNVDLTFEKALTRDVTAHASDLRIEHLALH